MDRDIILRKLDSLARCVSRIEHKRPTTLDELNESIDLQDILSINLERAIQVSVDIGAHLPSPTCPPKPWRRGIFDLYNLRLPRRIRRFNPFEILRADPASEYPRKSSSIPCQPFSESTDTDSISTAAKGMNRPSFPAPCPPKLQRRRISSRLEPRCKIGKIESSCSIECLHGVSRIMNAEDLEFVATEVRVGHRSVSLLLQDGSTHSFPVAFYPRLAAATDTELTQVNLRVGGRALRWENLDEDIWITDAILGRYPKADPARKTA